jgi:hypothetical protein
VGCIFNNASHISFCPRQQHHNPQLTTQKYVSSVLVSKKLTTYNSLLTTRRSPLNVKHFYFCPQTAFWFQNEQKPLKIVQKQT